MFFVCRCLGGFFGSGVALSCRWVFLSCICLVSLLGVLFLYMVVVGSVAGVCLLAFFVVGVGVLGVLCLGFVFLLYVWVPRFFVVLGLCFWCGFWGAWVCWWAIFLFFGGCRGFCFVGVVVFGVDFFIWLMWYFWRLFFWCRFFVWVGSAFFMLCWSGCFCERVVWVCLFLLYVSVFLCAWCGGCFAGWFGCFLGCGCCVCWFGCVGL